MAKKNSNNATSHDLKSQLEGVAASGEEPAATDAKETKPVDAMKETFTESLTRISNELPKAIRVRLVSFVKHAAETARKNATNWLSLAKEAAVLRDDIGNRWRVVMRDVLAKVGVPGNFNEYIDMARVISALVPNDVAFEALATITNGRGLIATQTSNVTRDGERFEVRERVASALFLQALKKYHVPESKNYEECLDWARSINLHIQVNTGVKVTTDADIYKALKGQFARLLPGTRNAKPNLAIATEAAFYCLRALHNVSVPLAEFVLDSFAQPNVGENDVYKGSLAILKKMQAEAKEARDTSAAVKPTGATVSAKSA